MQKAMVAFKKFLDKYEDKNELGFQLKITHTYHVIENAKEIAKNLNFSDEDIKLAELIGLLHDIGRFDEITFLKQFDSVKFDHASYGVKMLFEDNLIRNFIEDTSYDEIIKVAIDNHSRFCIEDGLEERSLLHAKIIRDADKLDNFRIKKEEKIEAIFPGIVSSKENLENSLLSDKVYEAVKKNITVDIRDRITPLDYWVCVIAFIFDLNFKKSFMVVSDNNYVNVMIDRFKYRDEKTQIKMEHIRSILNEFICEKIDSNQN